MVRNRNFSILPNFTFCPSFEETLPFVHAKSLQSDLTFATPWTSTRWAPLFMGLSREEYWSGLPCPPPGDLPDSGIEPTSPASPASAGRFFTTGPPGEVLQPREPADFLGRKWQDKAVRQPLGGQGRVV